MSYKLVGLLDRRKEKKHTYVRRCRICSKLYRTKSKGSQVCRDCKCNSNKAHTCPKCGLVKQFGNKMDACADCRKDAKVYWRVKKRVEFVDLGQGKALKEAQVGRSKTDRGRAYYFQKTPL